MDLNTLDNLKEKIKKFKYNSLEYVDYDDIKDYKILCDNNHLVVIYGLKNNFNMYEIHWASNEANILIDFIIKLNKEVYISFIPNQWFELFISNNFKEFGVLRDYWMNNLDSIPDCEDYIKLTEKECEVASNVTLSCKEQSREFF